MKFVFDFLYIIAVFFYLPAFFLKGKYQLDLRQRFGIYSDELKQRLKGRDNLIWLHAVSVGEIKAAAALLENLRNVFPKINFLISTITPTGNAVAKQIAGADDTVIYFPFDLSWVVSRALSVFRPKMFLIMETELWPNLIIEASKRKIPIAVINGRISDKAFPRYEKVSFFFKRVLKKIDLLCMQTEVDRKRIISLGADKDRVYVVGNIKFDQSKTNSGDVPGALGLKNNEQLIVAGSTHNNEEEIIARVFIRLKDKYPHTRLLIAPRHIHRTAEIKQVLKKLGLESLRISELNLSKISQGDNTVFILDIMGVLNQYYQLADIVFVGGSLVRHGGQNPIEPASYAKAVVFGRHMFNFSQIAKIFLDNNAAVCVDDQQQLYETLDILLSDQKKRKKFAAQAQLVVNENRGSLQRITTLLKEKIIF